MEARQKAGGLFIENKYTHWYWNIIENAALRKSAPSEVTELHHVLPKGRYMFPEFSSLKINKWNGVELTLREHFMCHRLLVKMTEGKAKRSAIYGLMRFSSGKKKCNSRQYEKARFLFSKERKGDPNPHKGKPGRTWSDEQKKKHSETMLKVMASFEVRKKCSDAKKGKAPMKHTTSSRMKISLAQRNLSAEQLARKSESKKGEKNGNYGKIWINNGTESMFFSKDEKIPEGWIAGRIMPAGK